MATLDEFVTMCREKPEDAEHGNDFRTEGGQVIIIGPDGNSKWFGLGSFVGCLECYDAPIPSNQSKEFQMMVNPRFQRDEIFDSGRLLGRVIEKGLVQITPNEVDYDSIISSAQRVYHNFSAFRWALPAKCRNEDNMVRANEGLQRIVDSETPEELMQNIIKESEDSKFSSVIYFIPGWARNPNWFIEMPVEYDALKAAHNQLKSKCRSTVYQMSIPDSIRDHEYVKCVNIDGEDLYEHLFLANTLSELQALQRGDDRLKGIKILYTGTVTANVLDSIGTLKVRRDTVICNPDIKGSKDYVDFVTSNSCFYVDPKKLGIEEP